jgi:hypothetical protein
VIGDGDEANLASDRSLVLPMAAGLATGHNGETVRLNDLDNFPEGAF